MFGLLGTYSVEMTQGGHPSERVTGVGLGTEEVPNAWTNTAFRFTFQLVERETQPVVISTAEPTTEPVEPEETAPVAPSDVEPEPSPPAPAQPELMALSQVLLEATQSHLAARSPRGKFYRYAREHGLGRRKSHDFSFEHAGIKYTAQAFETGIVYAPVGQWDQVTHAEYEG